MNFFTKRIKEVLNLFSLNGFTFFCLLAAVLLGAIPLLLMTSIAGDKLDMSNLVLSICLGLTNIVFLLFGLRIMFQDISLNKSIEKKNLLEVSDDNSIKLNFTSLDLNVKHDKTSTMEVLKSFSSLIIQASLAMIISYASIFLFKQEVNLLSRILILGLLEIVLFLSFFLSDRLYYFLSWSAKSNSNILNFPGDFKEIALDDFILNLNDENLNLIINTDNQLVKGFKYRDSLNEYNNLSIKIAQLKNKASNISKLINSDSEKILNNSDVLAYKEILNSYHFEIEKYNKLLALAKANIKEIYLVNKLNTITINE